MDLGGQQESIIIQMSQLLNQRVSVWKQSPRRVGYRAVESVDQIPDESDDDRVKVGPAL